MTEEKEYFIDYIAIGVIGFAIGQAIASVGGFQSFFGMVGNLAYIDWGRTVGNDVVIGIFAFLPAGFVAGYLCYKMLKVKGNMAGFTGGLMSFLAYFIITLIMALVQAGINYSNFVGTIMGLWVVLMVFALIFFPIGGFLAGMMQGMKVPMPSFLKFQFQRGPAAPPPPPGAVNICPTCGSPLRYVEQYKKWYCDKEKKYV